MLFLPALAPQNATVELYRGAPLGAPGYWAVEDAYLDKAEANADHGGGFSLVGGDGRTVLIRFGDLARVVGRGRRVTSATLVLTPSGPGIPALKGATAIDAPWGEGPQATLTRILATAEGGKKPTGPARGAATWNERRAGIAPWPAPGTPGGAAVAANGEAKATSFEIAGLGPTVQGWADQPWTNHGLALTFAGDTEFFSSQSPSGRPRLVLTTEAVVTTMETKPDLTVLWIDRPGGKWTAHVLNEGSAPAPATKGRWWANGNAGAKVDVPALAPRASATFALAGPEPKDDLQVPNLAFALDPVAKDVDSANDRLDVFTGGKPVKLTASAGVAPQQVVAYWNEAVAPQSRFSFAPQGVTGRVRLDGDPRGALALDLPAGLAQIGVQLGLPSVADGGDLYPGLMGYGDTRFEGTIPGRLALPYEPYPDPATSTALLEPTGLLSATDVGRLNDGGLPLPRIVILRVSDFVGRTLAGLELTVEGGGLRQKVTTADGGTVALPPLAFKPDLSNGRLVVRASYAGIAQEDVVKAWQLSDAFRRSGSPVVVADVRLNLPVVPLEIGTNLADGKAMTDSAGKPYAFGDPLPDAAGSYVEMDLGRDRTIGEIAVRPGGRFPDRFEIRVLSTGTKSDESGLWSSELATSWSRRNRAEEGWLPYRGPSQRIRFVRIVSRSGGPGSLAGLRIVPVRVSTSP